MHTHAHVQNARLRYLCLVVVVHLFFLEHTSFMGRIIVKILFDFIGLTLLVISTSLGEGYFWLCLLGVVFIGTSASFGETVTLW